MHTRPEQPKSTNALSLLFLVVLCCGTALSADAQSIPPNYGAYTLNPHYDENATLGWAEERVEETLGRGLVAVPTGEDEVYLGWRLLRDDPQDVAFNIYRATGDGPAVRLNDRPLTQTTDFVDADAPLDRENAYSVRPVRGGREGEASGPVVLPANPPARPYKVIRLRDDLPEDGVHKVGIGDLDGDGEYDFVVKRPRGRLDPSHDRPSPTTFKVEGYTSEGKFLWRNDLGWSIELGTWYSPMIVYDFNGDGKAEVALKTGEGDPRNERGRVVSGPEYVSVWDGETGEQIARADWIPRGEPADWGDLHGNRMNRHMLGVAYLDGRTPALLVLRGIYGLMKMDAWLLHADSLRKAWSWTNETAGWKYQGQSQHNIHVADLDADGRDEILYGSIAIDHDGRTMWSTGLGHGDRFYVTDVDPDRAGLEVWYSYEDPHPQNGVSLWDARTGNLIFGTPEETADDQVDRALAGDIDPDYPGMELWADGFFFTSRGETIEGEVPPRDGLVWWDADLLREIEHRGTISKWQGDTLTTEIEGEVLVWADLFGDWREEILTYADGELRIYTTTMPAQDRRVTLMQDPLYRKDVALKAMGYDQVPMTSYYLGTREGLSAARPIDSREQLRPLPEPADPGLPTLFFIGDSTVRNGSGDGANGQWGWGEPISAYFDSTRINVANRALGGRSSRTYLTQGYWDRLLTMLKPGDVVLMQFGHNDGGALNDTLRARGTLRGVGPETEEIDNLLTGQREVVHTYGWYLRNYIADIRARGATPVVASPVPRKIWKEGAIVRDRYAGWAQEVAEAEGVPFVDLHEAIARTYERLGPEAVERLFADERTHTNRAGAELNARSVIAVLKGLQENPLAPYLSEKAASVHAYAE